ncbi:hypothetical protein A2U01_0036774, partial [Trifolium medium]|nr:hypothetical protein [Trifolium medium]
NRVYPEGHVPEFVGARGGAARRLIRAGFSARYAEQGSGLVNLSRCFSSLCRAG